MTVAGSVWRLVSGSSLSKLAGFATSTALLAATSLVATPAMVAASGPEAWGAIALGQAVGAVASLVVSYGWTVSGPAIVARGDVAIRRREYVDSLRVKTALLLPGSLGAGVVSALLSHGYANFAVAGAISATVVALSSNWYFAGLARPYLWLVMEVVPRVGGTAVGIGLMLAGCDAIVGVACTAGGMILGFCAVTVWVFKSTSRVECEQRARTSTLIELLVLQRNGIASMAASQIGMSAPFGLVALMCPSALPAYALVDRIRQLLSSGLNPVVVVFQGWVPRGAGSRDRDRSKTALTVAGVLAVVVTAASFAAGPALTRWLGDGQIFVPVLLILLISLVIGLDLFNSVLAYAVMAAAGRVGYVARATTISICVSIPVAVLGVYSMGAVGAIAGIFCGLLVRVSIELFHSHRLNKEDRSNSEDFRRARKTRDE